MFFDDLKNQEKLGRILESWLGTPYRHHSGIKTQGTDCVHFVIGVLGELGIQNISINEYPPKGWNMHKCRELLVEGCIENGFIEADKNRPMAGDILLYKFGKAASHAGIYYKGRVYQAISSVGVERISFSDKKWRKRLQASFRVP